MGDIERSINTKLAPQEVVEKLDNWANKNLWDAEHKTESRLVISKKMNTDRPLSKIWLVIGLILYLIPGIIYYAYVWHERKKLSKIYINASGGLCTIKSDSFPQSDAVLRSITSEL